MENVIEKKMELFFIHVTIYDLYNYFIFIFFLKNFKMTF